MNTKQNEYEKNTPCHGCRLTHSERGSRKENAEDTGTAAHRTAAEVTEERCDEKKPYL